MIVHKDKVNEHIFSYEMMQTDQNRVICNGIELTDIQSAARATTSEVKF